VGDYGPTYREVESEREPHELEMEFEAYGLLEDLQAEHRRMLREMSPEYQREQQWSEAVRYLVDAGLIQSVLAVSNGDAVQLALLELGDRATWPIDVYNEAGEKATFEPPKKPATGWKWMFHRARRRTA